MLVQWICSQIIFAIMYQKKSICYLELTFVLTLEVNTKAVLEETFSKLNKDLIYWWMLRRKSHELMTTAGRVVGQTGGNIAVRIPFPNEDPVRNAETELTAEETKISEVKGL
jgi:hypothetical protein